MAVKGRPPRAALRTAGTSDASRIEQVHAVTERITRLFGVKSASIMVSDGLKPGCRLTSGGIELIVNPGMSEEIAYRGTGRKPNLHESAPAGHKQAEFTDIRGCITLAEVDAITACFLAMRASDYLDPSYGEIPFGDLELYDSSKRYLTSMLDDIAAELRLLNLPFIRDRFEAYISRQERLYMRDIALQKQFMRTLRLYMLESDPQPVNHSIVVRYLGTPDNQAPCVEALRRVLADPKLGYRERTLKAREIIGDMFAEMARIDATAYTDYEMHHLFDDEDMYGASNDSAEDEQAERDNYDSANNATRRLKTVSKDNVDTLIIESGESRLPNDETPTLMLPAMSAGGGTRILGESLDQQYARILAEGEDVIEGLADLFIGIAQPKESLSVPRYDPRLSVQGVRLNPGAQVDAHIQLVTGLNRSIWQRVYKKPRFQAKTFNGLDVFLLIDVSWSMLGVRAHNAAIMATYLVEGLQRAYERCKQAAAGGSVDIRNQLLAFGKGWAILTPLTTLQTEADKKRAFRAIDFPSSLKTMVGGALGHVAKCARDNPDREVLCLVVSDGQFTDMYRARKLAMDMPGNVYLGHVNIGQMEGIPLSDNFEAVSNPANLPEKMKTVLQQKLAANT